MIRQDGLSCTGCTWFGCTEANELGCAVQDCIGLPWAVLSYAGLQLRVMGSIGGGDSGDGVEGGNEVIGLTGATKEGKGGDETIAGRTTT